MDDVLRRNELAMLENVPGYNLLTSKEVAAAFGISEGTLAGMVRRGEIPIIRLAGRTVRFYEDDLRRWIRKHRVFSAPPEKKSPREFFVRIFFLGIFWGRQGMTCGTEPR